MNLSLLSAGGVTPAGLGTDAITAPWPVTATHSHGGVPVQAGLIEQKDPSLLRWQQEPRLRRASPITYFMIEAVEQALQGAPHLDRDRTGVVASFFLGCLVYSVRFYRQITEEGRRFASPVLFPETVFNSPLSHVVATLGLGGPVYSQIGDKTCWASSLRTAQCWLANGDCDHVIVLAAEEFDPHEVDALHSGGLLRGGLQPCEGAIALLLGPSASGPTIGAIADGYDFRTRQEVLEAAERCLAEFSPPTPLLDTATGWTRTAAAKIGRSIIGPKATLTEGFTLSAAADTPLLDTATGWTRTAAAKIGRSIIGPKATLTEGFTLSAAADTMRALDIVASGQSPEVIVPVWGLTRQVAAYRVTA